MLKVSTRAVEREFRQWLQFITLEAKAGETKRAFAAVLKGGLKAVEKRAKALAKPKRKKRKKRGYRPPPKRTGMLRKSYTTISGVARKGKGKPYAVVGPKKNFAKEFPIGNRIMLVQPSRYSHLVEFGFMNKGGRRKKKKTLLGHKVEFFRPNRPRRGSLAHTLKRFMRGANRLSRGMIFRLYARVLTMAGSKSTWVQGQFILTRAYRESAGEIKSGIAKRMGVEIKKLFRKVKKRNDKKAALAAAKAEVK